MALIRMSDGEDLKLEMQSHLTIIATKVLFLSKALGEKYFPCSYW